MQAICGHLHDFSLRLKVEETHSTSKEVHGHFGANGKPSEIIDNWDKQGTLEQMESMEQLGLFEKNLVRRANTSDDLLADVAVDIVTCNRSACQLPEREVSITETDVTNESKNEKIDQNEKESSSLITKTTSSSSTSSISHPRGILERQISLREETEIFGSTKNKEVPKKSTEHRDVSNSKVLIYIHLDLNIIQIIYM